MLLELAIAGGIMGIYWWETVEGGLLPEFARVPLQLLDPKMQAILHCQCLAHLILFSLMTAATWIDIDEKTIPDEITLTGTLIGVTLIAWLPKSLLPNVLINKAGVLDAGNVVWLFTPLDPFAGNRLCMPAFGHKGLLFGLVCIWFWVFAMLPRTWYAAWPHKGHAFECLRGAIGKPMSYVLVLIGLVGSALVYCFWLPTENGLEIERWSSSRAASWAWGSAWHWCGWCA